MPTWISALIGTTFGAILGFFFNFLNEQRSRKIKAFEESFKNFYAPIYTKLYRELFLEIAFNLKSESLPLLLEIAEECNDLIYYADTSLQYLIQPLEQKLLRVNQKLEQFEDHEPDDDENKVLIKAFDDIEDDFKSFMNLFYEQYKEKCKTLKYQEPAFSPKPL